MAERDVVTKSFEAVKTFLIGKQPKLKKVVLRFCDEADYLYENSKKEQAGEGKPPRVYAHALHYSNTICVTPLMAELSEEQRQGIIVHEFGHIYCGIHHKEYDADEDADADLVVITIFGVNLHYDDDDIESVVLPIGSEPIEDAELTDEELEEAIGEMEEEESEEEENEYGLDAPSSEDLKRSLELVPEEVDEDETRKINEGKEGPVIDAETEEE